MILGDFHENLLRKIQDWSKIFGTLYMRTSVCFILLTATRVAQKHEKKKLFLQFHGSTSNAFPSFRCEIRSKQNDCTNTCVNKSHNVTSQCSAYLVDTSQSQQILGYDLKIGHKCSLKGKSYCTTRDRRYCDIQLSSDEVRRPTNRSNEGPTELMDNLYSFAHELINKLIKDC